MEKSTCIFFPKCMVQKSQSEKVSQSGSQLQPLFIHVLLKAPRPKIKFCLFAIAYLPTIFPPTQKILLGFLDEVFFFNESALCSSAKGDLVI